MIFIKDEEFIRGNCPMTKEEVRILSISKLELKNNYNTLDVGSGTGSIAVQMSKICTNGTVTAIEINDDALSVLYKNKQKFNCNNMSVLKGDAANMDISGEFDSIFIGGSKGKIEPIIKKYTLKLKKNGKIVLNFITINNVYTAMKTLKELNFHVECSQISVSKTKGESYMLFSNNPIFIVVATKTKD